MVNAAIAEFVHELAARMCVACLVAVAVPPVCLSAPAVVFPAPMPEFADTEVSTNLAVSVDGVLPQDVEMTFALHGECVSNCLQVAFGLDADGDGILGADESEAVFGWRNGRYFAENVPRGIRIEEPADDDGATSRVFTVGFRVSTDRGIHRLTATNETGAAVFASLPATAQGWPCRHGWDMMRVTRRGPGAPDEWFRCDVRPHFFVIRLM